MSSTAEKASLAAGLIKQSPPGEIDDIIADIRALINDDAALETGLLPALEEYNIDQFVTTVVPGSEHPVLISDAAALPSNRYLDPRTSRTFTFDHLRLSSSDPAPHTPSLSSPDADPEPFRAHLEAAVLAYVAEHYPDGVAAVYSRQDGEKGWEIRIVGNKYSHANYWSGRWRSAWSVDAEKGELRGKVKVDVHYFENGNVQLHTSHTPTLPLPTHSPSTAQDAKKLVDALAKEEARYQAGVNDVYAGEFGERTFRALRRALPVTREKVDWDKVGNYRIGAEIGKGRE